VYGEIGRGENFAKLDKMLGDSDPAVRVSAAAAILKVASNQAPNRG
jgi:HEAT repeat protein